MKKSAGRADDNAVPANPADPARVGFDLQPLIFLIENLQLSPVVQRKCILRFLDWRLAGNGLLGYDDRARRETGGIKGGGKTCAH